MQCNAMPNLCLFPTSNYVGKYRVLNSKCENVCAKLWFMCPGMEKTTMVLSPINVTPSKVTNDKVQNGRAFRMSESESQVRGLLWSPSPKIRTLKTLRTRTQRVCLFTHLYCKEVNISQKNSEISILKILLFPFINHMQISTIVKTS
jgi:hypothetical protein